ncbi:SDR family NAD(P)-dependent oxidoreductase [Mycobacterium paraintracellulare]|uniref:SDR family NAD(P)-dependent oxidoreductase n=1 Tax=Mycobacterium paraintracellulare TaxID=1138383 RepID=UPI001925A5CE|nr:glucose 1-dehydrogenase [Mycobacterium paraintracellulare]BCP14255.1 diacetyl reductase [(S)-acetoin forming] [Mycobacterium paraintracellulare]
MGSLNEKVCVITGAAGGLGSAISRRLAAEGALVVAGDINTEDLEILTENIGATGGQAIGIRCDSTSVADLKMLVGRAADKFGRVDAMFNVAGIPGYYALDDISLEVFEKVMRLNVFGVIAGTQVAAAAMRKKKTGTIINMCSVAGRRGFPGNAVYSASKFAVRGITQSFAQELAPDGITVNAICPGVFQTPIWDAVSEVHNQRHADQRLTGVEIAGMYSQPVALKRVGMPDDITGIAAFLASNDAAYITGQCMIVDGGLVYD